MFSLPRFLSVVPLVLASFLLGLEQRLVFTGAYDRQREFVETPTDYGIPYDTVTITTEDGVALNAWALSAEQANGRWLLYFHGQGANISHYLSLTAQWVERGYKVLMVDYRGYGASEGTPSEAGLYLDARASYAYLLEQGVEPTDIVLYGFSLGSGVAIDLASKVEVGALVVEAGYTSLVDVVRSLYSALLTGFVTNRFDSAAKIANVTAPTAFIHASDDQVVPESQGRALFERATAAKVFLTVRGGHLAMLDAPQNDMFAALTAFLDEQMD